MSIDGKIFNSEFEAKNYELNLSHIVLIDDDAEILEIFSSLLHTSGFKNFKTFADPMEATAYISNTKVDHVFTDFHMPLKGMNGMTIKDKCEELSIPCTIVSSDYRNADLYKNDLIQNILPLLKTI
jgi:DNA-binding NtrC family response regulator